MRTRKFTGARRAAGVIEFFTSNVPQTQFNSITSEYTLNEALRKSRSRSIAILLTEDECAPSNPAFREFVEIANENSEHDFSVASDDRVFKHFNLPRGQPHFIFHRKPEVQLKGENLIEVWDKTQTMR